MIAVKNGETLAQMSPELVEELVNPSIADKIHFKSTKHVEWKCNFGHTWSVSVANRVWHNTGCPYCTNKKVWVGFNDLWTTEPELSKQLKDASVGYKYVNKSGAYTDWICELGHEWNAQIKSRSGGVGCPVCKNRRILIGFNDFATTDPDLYSQLSDKSLVFTRGYGGLVEWECSAGHKWFCTVNNRTNNNRGCPKCDKTQTSRSENSLINSLREVGFNIDHDHTYRLPVLGWTKKNTQVDAFFKYGKIGVVVEYDGAYWHSKRRETDERKTKMLIDNGLVVVRVVGQDKKTKLAPLSISNVNLLQLSMPHDKHHKVGYCEVSKQIKRWLDEKDNI